MTEEEAESPPPPQAQLSMAAEERVEYEPGCQFSETSQ